MKKFHHWKGVDVTKGSGSGVTPPKIVEYLKDAVSKSSQSEVARNTGLGVAAINRYLNGIGFPTEATIQKLSKYFQVPVPFLLGLVESPEGCNINIVSESFINIDMPEILQDKIGAILVHDFAEALSAFLKGGPIEDVLKMHIINTCKVINVLANYYRYEGAMGKNPYYKSPNINPADILYQQLFGMAEEAVKNSKEEQ